MNRTPAERLREARSKRYETAKAAADAHGWNPVTYRAHESGIRNFGVDQARVYAQAFNTTVPNLLGITVNGGVNGNGLSPSIPSVIDVPVVAVAAAGAFRADDGLEFEGVQVPAVPHPKVLAAVQYAVLIDGPSVNKRIADGAYAICAPFDKYPGGPTHGQLVHVVRQRAGLQEHTIKELHYTRAGRVLMPCSTDPRYQERLELAADDEDAEVRIAGVVIGAFQPF